MSNKNYSPVQIRNPTSLQHVANVLPGQVVHLILDGDLYKEPKVEISGSYLRVNDAGMIDNKHHYYILHEEVIEDWSNYSNSLLGEIWIDSKETLAKLLIVLQCKNKIKNDFMTVVNPDCFDIRLKPYQILEVVLHHQEFGYQDDWEWEWESDLVKIDPMGHDSKNLSGYYYCFDDPDHQYSSCPRIYNEKVNWGRQHHYWFRFDDGILDLIDGNYGTNYVGKFRFMGTANRYYKNSHKVRLFADVYVDANKKYRNKVLHTLTLKRYEDCKPGSSRALVVVPQKKWKPEPVKPYVFDTEVTKIHGDLTDGCKIIPSLNDYIPRDDNYYPYYDDWD